jgi:hypothetical protein
MCFPGVVSRDYLFYYSIDFQHIARQLNYRVSFLVAEKTSSWSSKMERVRQCDAEPIAGKAARVRVEHKKRPAYR